MLVIYQQQVQEACHREQEKDFGTREPEPQTATCVILVGYLMP